MKQTLAMLIDLQGIDDELRELRETKQQLATLVDDNLKGLEVFDRMLAGLADRIAETRGFYHEKEEEIRETETNIARSRGRLSSITSQKELTALNKELEASRRANQQRNEELMRLLEQLEAAEADHALKTKERDGLRKEMALVEQALRDKLNEKEAGVSDLNARRARIRESLPRDLTGKYERIAKARNGMAVADVPESRCAGCNMSVPPQVFIRLQRMETFEQCATCSRILVYKRGLVEGVEPRSDA